ncbi:MAG: hypothetical protein MGG11_21630 [Trichodesmium sp. MAG_R03]|nr:hypothetical protein [Trichodesmium sp. MAG_R03]
MNTYSVIMLGPRGSGKTVFLASMHKKLSTQGKLDFFLKVDGEEKRKYLNKINKELVFGEKWPSATQMSELSEWEFTCRVQAKDLLIYNACKFVYLDYAGDRVNTEMGEEDEEFNEQIRRADIMLILLDGQKLCSLMRREKFGLEWLTDDLPNLLNVAQNIQNKPLHFVISKWDIIEPHYNLQEIRNVLFQEESFGNIVRKRNEANKPIRLIPVSSVGKGFAKLEDNIMIKNVGVLPKPFQVEVPLACILPDIIQEQVDELIERIRQEEDKIKGIEIKPELNRKEKLGRFFGSIGAGIKKIQESLPQKYKFGENLVEDFIEFVEKPAKEKEAEAYKRVEELRAKQQEYISKVVDEETALKSVVASFQSIENRLNIDFPESDLSKVL